MHSQKEPNTVKKGDLKSRSFESGLNVNLHKLDGVESWEEIIPPEAGVRELLKEHPVLNLLKDFKLGKIDFEFAKHLAQLCNMTTMA